MNSDLASAHICIDEEGNEYICVSKREGAGKSGLGGIVLIR